MTWIPVRPWSFSFIVTVPGNAPAGWEADFFDPNACAALYTRNVFPFPFAPAAVRLTLAPAKSETIIRPARLKAMAAKMSLNFSANDIRDEGVPVLSLPLMLIDAAVPPGLVSVDEDAERRGALKLFPSDPEGPTDRRRGSPSPDEVVHDTHAQGAPLLRVLVMQSVYELKIRSVHGFTDCPDLQAILTLMGYQCERQRQP